MVTIYTQTKKISNYFFRIENQFNLVRLLALPNLNYSLSLYDEYEKAILLSIINYCFLFY